MNFFGVNITSAAICMVPAFFNLVLIFSSYQVIIYIPFSNKLFLTALKLFCFFIYIYFFKPKSCEFFSIYFFKILKGIWKMMF